MGKGEGWRGTVVQEVECVIGVQIDVSEPIEDSKKVSNYVKERSVKGF
jgi:hypothetical protein